MCTRNCRFRGVEHGKPEFVDETDEEIIDVLRKLYEAGCDAVTLGQYPQSKPDCVPVDRYVTPGEFQRLREIAAEIGFVSVASAPLVRSSYHTMPLK